MSPRVKPRVKLAFSYNARSAEGRSTAGSGMEFTSRFEGETQEECQTLVAAYLNQIHEDLVADTQANLGGKAA